MKKIIITLIVIIIVLLISGLFENKYCHILTTTDPIGAGKDYRHTTGLCKYNSYVSLPGALFLGAVLNIK